MKNKKLIIIILGIAAVSVLGVTILKSRSTPKSSQNIVKVIKPRMGDIRITISSPGTVLPKNRLELKPPVNGRIDKVMVEEGQKVKLGEVLAWMSSTDRAALLDAARGQGEEKLKYWQDVYKSIPLLAPIDGEVIVGTIQPGQTVTVSDAVLVLSDHLIARAQVDETDVGKIKLKQPALVTLDAYPDTKIDAVVDHIYYESKTINNVTVYEVDLKLSEVPEFFRSGMNTNIAFIVEEKKNILLIPSDVVGRQQGDSFVFVRGDNAEEIKRPVVLGVTDDKDVEVISGVSIDDEIISKSKKYSLPKSSTGSNPFMPPSRRK